MPLELFSEFGNSEISLRKFFKKKIVKGQKFVWVKARELKFCISLLF
jgi:hypothetical protein